MANTVKDKGFALFSFKDSIAVHALDNKNNETELREFLLVGRENISLIPYNGTCYINQHLWKNNIRYASFRDCIMRHRTVPVKDKYLTYTELNKKTIDYIQDYMGSVYPLDTSIIKEKNSEYVLIEVTGNDGRTLPKRNYEYTDTGIIYLDTTCLLSIVISTHLDIPGVTSIRNGDEH